MIPKKKHRKNKPKFKVWNEEISSSLNEARKANKIWIDAGSPNVGQLIDDKKNSWKNFKKPAELKLPYKIVNDCENK